MNSSLSKKCSIQSGLQCGSKQVLDIGTEYTVTSKMCANGKYPGNDRCNWQFDVQDNCLPTVECSYLDIVANWRFG